mgnify:CR=1 FL=1
MHTSSLDDDDDWSDDGDDDDDDDDDDWSDDGDDDDDDDDWSDDGDDDDDDDWSDDGDDDDDDDDWSDDGDDDDDDDDWSDDAVESTSNVGGSGSFALSEGNGKFRFVAIAGDSLIDEDARLKCVKHGIVEIGRRGHDDTMNDAMYMLQGLGWRPDDGEG